jgi:S-adenosylmethionine:tRNA ribosyltransferase-isomerase
MRVDLFDFDLPADRIAQHPVRPRDAARLLAVGSDTLDDRRIRELPDLLRPGDLLVFNDTRVIPARLVGKRGDATVEVTLHQPVREAPDNETALWRAFARPARKCRLGDRLTFGADLGAEVLAKGEGGEITLGFACSPEALLESLGAHGQMPLPPYIKRPPEGDPQDRIDYQTMFAERAGAIAAPTAALHFRKQDP